MLSTDQIKAIALKLQTTEINVAREYCQHLFLSNLYILPNSEKLLFKGGTALRILFNSPRFSEDLDFTGIDINPKQLENLIINSLNSVSQTGIKTNLIEAKSTSGGYLSIFSCAWLDFKFNIQLEISKRTSMIAKNEIHTVVQKYLPAYTIVALYSEGIVAEKIKATLTRGKPRDFFDIYFLLRSRLIQSQQKNQLQDIKRSLASHPINFSKELKQFLPVSFHPIIKDFEKTLLAEIQRNL